MFYRLLDSHLSEMMPIIYTPTVGEACEHFSDIYRRARLFISYPNRDRIDDMLQNATKQNVKVIVVTDGERIPRPGRPASAAWASPSATVAVHRLRRHQPGLHTLPVVLDVGTNNPQRLNDPLYMGWRHPRISGEVPRLRRRVYSGGQTPLAERAAAVRRLRAEQRHPAVEPLSRRICCFQR